MTPSEHELKMEVVVGASGAAVVTMSGPLTLQTLFDFQALVRQHYEKPLILDFSGVPYMDSAGLGSVISAYTSRQVAGRGFAMIGLSDRIRTLLAVTHTNDILPCFESLQAAEASIAAPGR